MVPALSCMFVSENTCAIARAIKRFSFQIQRCIVDRQLKLGQILHGRLIKTSLAFNTFLANRLIEMYAKCGGIPAAEAAFSEIPKKNAFSWNTLLSCYCRSGRFDSALRFLTEMPEPDIVSYNAVISGLMHFGRHSHALEIFRRMKKSRDRSRHDIDKFTVVAVAGACGGVADLDALRQIHGAVVSAGIDMSLIMNNALIDAYGKCGAAETAKRIFERMETRDVFSWTSIVTAHASCGELQEAHRVFDIMPKRSAATWSALIAGYAQRGQREAALNLFRVMIEEGLAPTAFSLVSALGACTSTALFGMGKQIHGYLMRRSAGEIRHFDNLFIQNSLIDMYAKCGEMESARQLFQRMQERDIISWNSMATGFAWNGDGKCSLDLFKEMTERGVVPNNVTLLAALSACSHAGMLSKVPKVLELAREHDLDPKPEHMAAITDLLGRSRHLKEAAKLTTIASPEDNGQVWGTILGACHTHGVLDLAKTASEALFSLDPCNSGRYITLCNIYSSAGCWDEARRLRKLMKNKGVKKEPACSWIELHGVKHAFLAGDTSHCRAEDIYITLTFLADHSKEPVDSL